MNQKQKKEMMGVVCEGIEEVVMPALGDILEEQKKIKNDVRELKGLKKDMKELKEGQDYQSGQLEVINRKLDATITLVDKHDVLMKK